MTGAGAGPRVVRFSWRDLPEQLEAFGERWPDARADERGWVFSPPAAGPRLRVPLAALRVRPGEAIGAYAARFHDPRERQLVVLLQAGAAAIGYWDGEDLLDHKVLRRYVVRGRGRAQPTHLRTRGKSRYGSRLRLQNWRRLLACTNERLRRCWDEFGAPERVFHAAPVRAWAELFLSEPPPPFARHAAELQRVPMHVHTPDFAELRRVRGWLLHGRLELP
ncbi:MAG TPA: hypothetical protein VFZ65_15405 [Planctomycetota bacterium]|nr:hypothetical protein [Planctomycetota bacterium]